MSFDFSAAMDAVTAWEWSLDGWMVAIGILCACACALLGNFLVLRKMSMMGDAISHAVLPGLAGSFLIWVWLQESAWLAEHAGWLQNFAQQQDARSSLIMFVGAAVVGVLTALFTQWIRGAGRVDEGASMGVVFTTLFAIGLVMMVQAADTVDLDAGCVLYGALEYTPLDLVSVGGMDVPRVALTLGAVLLVNVLFVGLFFKELKITSFDPSLATTMGINASVMHYALMTLVAITAVASFEAVGNILVVAVLIVPPAAAFMLTDRLGLMIVISLLVAAASAVFGHLAAVAVPAGFGYPSVSSAAGIAVAAGVLFGIAVLVGPRHGVLSRMFEQARLSWRIASEDILAMLYRIDEFSREGTDDVLPEHLSQAMSMSPWKNWLLIQTLQRKRLVRREDGRLHLTGRGRTRGRQLVRSHRLWETYLDRYADLRPDHLHLSAERLEHATDAEMREALNQRIGSPQTDPQGKPIPEDRDSIDV